MSDYESIDISSSSSGVTPAEPRHEREGLPPGYRMRADAHYVDQLTSRRSERLHTDALRADAVAKPETRRESVEPRLDRDVRETAGDPPQRRGERVFAELSEDLSTITSAAALLAGESSPVARRVSVDLIRAHAWRASWLFRAHKILEGLHRTHVRPRAIGDLLAQIRDGLAPECRLTGSSLIVTAGEWNTPVEIDEDAFVAGVAGAVLATLSLSASGDPLVIRVTATLADGDLKTLEVSQDAVQVCVHDGRGRDLGWGDRTGGWTSSLGATVAKAAGHLANGEVSFYGNERRGSTVRFTFRK